MLSLLARYNPDQRLQDCVATIKEHGFIASPFPVIITLENHTDAENQVRKYGNCIRSLLILHMLYTRLSCFIVMTCLVVCFKVPLVRFLRDILGEELFVPPTDEQREKWLSPVALKGKFIIRTKVGNHQV